VRGSERHVVASAPGCVRRASSRASARTLVSGSRRPTVRKNPAAAQRVRSRGRALHGARALPCCPASGPCHDLADQAIDHRVGSGWVKPPVVGGHGRGPLRNERVRDDSAARLRTRRARHLPGVGALTSASRGASPAVQAVPHPAHVIGEPEKDDPAPGLSFATSTHEVGHRARSRRAPDRSIVATMQPRRAARVISRPRVRTIHSAVASGRAPAACAVYSRQAVPSQATSLVRQPPPGPQHRVSVQPGSWCANSVSPGCHPQHSAARSSQARPTPPRGRREARTPRGSRGHSTTLDHGRGRRRSFWRRHDQCLWG
jgi:hypothetical protein